MTHTPWHSPFYLCWRLKYVECQITLITVICLFMHLESDVNTIDDPSLCTSHEEVSRWSINDSWFCPFWDKVHEWPCALTCFDPTFSSRGFVDSKFDSGLPISLRPDRSSSDLHVRSGSLPHCPRISSYTDTLTLPSGHPDLVTPNPSRFSPTSFSFPVPRGQRRPRYEEILNSELGLPSPFEDSPKVDSLLQE